MSKPATPIPEVTKSETVHKGYLDVRIDHLKLPHGPTLAYTVIHIGVDAVAIVAKTADGKFLVTKEYRHPVGKWLLGCPGGRIDPGESPLDAAKRELLEETGYAGAKATPIGTIFPLPSVTEQSIHFILIEAIEWKQPPEREPFELIETQLMTPEEIRQQMASGAPVDGVFCTALFLADQKRSGYD